MGKIYAYIGKWAMNRDPAAPKKKLGIGIYEYEPENGLFTHLQDVMEEVAMGHISADGKRNILYCANEVREVPGVTAGGLVYALKIDPADGSVHQISRVPSYAPMPCYAATDKDGEFLLVTNHSQANTIIKTVKAPDGRYHVVKEMDESPVILYPLGQDGGIGEACDIVKLQGHGAGPRQTNPHPHSVVMSPDGKLFFVCDKGADRLWTFGIDRQRRQLVMLGSSQGYHTAPGSSPRYSAVHPEKPWLFVNNETAETVNSYAYDENGVLKAVSCASVIPEGFDLAAAQRSPMNHPAQSDLKLHPNGKTLYSLVRGVDLIAVMEVDAETGELRQKQVLKLCEDKAPLTVMEGARGMAISPDGRFLHIIVNGRGEISTWAIAEDGSLTHVRDVPVGECPANITFMSF